MRCRDRERFDVKGPRASAWLIAHGLVIPEQANTWIADPASAPGVDGSGSDALLIARLGASEFFLDEPQPAPVIARLSSGLRERPAGVYPVLREDWGFRLVGAESEAVLAEVCNVAFGALAPERQSVVMTMMVGVAVLVVPRIRPAAISYHIWCDPTFGPYLEDTLAAIVAEHGGQIRD